MPRAPSSRLFSVAKVGDHISYLIRRFIHRGSGKSGGRLGRNQDRVPRPGLLRRERSQIQTELFHRSEVECRRPISSRIYREEGDTTTLRPEGVRESSNVCRLHQHRLTPPHWIGPVKQVKQRRRHREHHHACLCPARSAGQPVGAVELHIQQMPRQRLSRVAGIGLGKHKLCPCNPNPRGIRPRTTSRPSCATTRVAGNPRCLPSLTRRASRFTACPEPQPSGPRSCSWRGSARESPEPRPPYPPRPRSD
jgi:hypothetical protein